MKNKNSIYPGSRFRMLIVCVLDRLYPDMCWARLAMWALFPKFHEFREVLELRYTAGGCARKGEPNYCGKCDIKGQTNESRP